MSTDDLRNMQNPPEWMRAPVWYDIAPGETLQRESAREHRDEMHICPLQLTVIGRCIDLWSAENDIVASWFAGIGSELFVAIKKGRQALGVELKKSYFEQGVRNLKVAEMYKEQMSLPLGGNDE